MDNIEITSEYKKVFSLIDDPKHQFIFITGQAGTGKSILIKCIRENIDQIPVVAPTGIAALNVEGQTIHSFFRIPPGMINPDEIEPDRKKYDFYKNLQFIIIDEISMVRADLLDLIDVSLRVNRLNDRPFGGVRIIAVGDLFQLPPIISDPEELLYLQDKYKTPYFMSADVIQKTKLVTVELTKVFRQTNTEFISLLSNIREGNDLENTLDKLNSCYSSYNDDNYITLTPDNATADTINNTKLELLPDTNERIFEAIVEGSFDVRRPPAPQTLRLRVGARVMFLKNDSRDRWKNGSLGVVTDLGNKYDDSDNDNEDTYYGGIKIKLDDTNLIVDVKVESWENKKYAYNSVLKRIFSIISGSYKQIPLNLAWACTIHKSQGQTFSKVNIDITKNIFANGQLYVALSRCRTIEGIHINRPIRINDVKVDPLIKNFYKNVIRNN